MTAKNLGLLIGPNISWNLNQKRSDMAEMLMKQNMIIAHMIDNIEDIKQTSDCDWESFPLLIRLIVTQFIEPKMII